MAVKQDESVGKKKALDAAVAQIEKQFGKGAIMLMGSAAAKARDIQVISTGALSLDVALGIGGVPRGRVIEVYGPEAGGKTTLALHILAEAQKKGGTVAFVDAEHAFDPHYARRIGVQVDDLLVSQPGTGEEALEIVDALVCSGAVDAIVVDSVAALVPRAEIEGEMGDSHMGLQARLMSQALRKLTASISRSRTMCLFINQIRLKIGIVFGNPETTTGGRALKFYSSVRLDIRRTESLKSGTDIVGNAVRVKVVKNKLAPPFTEARFDIIFGEGISNEGCLIDLGLQAGFVQKSGSWYTYGPERLGQGKENARKLLKENKALAKRLEKEIRAKYLESKDEKKESSVKPVKKETTELKAKA